MNLLITGALYADESFFSEIRKLGVCITYVQDERNPALEVDAETIDGILCNSFFLTHPIEKFRNLKYIQLTSAGYDRVPMDYAQMHHIRVLNAGGVYSIPIAESVLCGVLQIYKHSAFFSQNQERKKWEKNRNQLELANKTVCIVGCGSVGTACAKRFSAFDCTVIGVDIAEKETAFFQHIIPIERLNEVLPTADVVVLTLPLTPKTYHFFDAYRLGLLSDRSVFVNVSRGAVVDEKALECRLPDLLGAVLDVFEEEPLSPDSQLWSMSNVLITPHNSFVGDGNDRRLKQVILANLSAYLKEGAFHG